MVSLRADARHSPAGVSEPSADLELDVVGGLTDRLRLPAAHNRDGVLPGPTFSKGPVERRLPEAVGAGPAGRGGLSEIEVDNHLAIGAVPHVMIGGHDVMLDLVHDSQPLEDPHGLTVEPHRARKRVHGGKALDHAHAMAVATEERREREAHRPRAHDRHIERLA